MVKSGDSDCISTAPAMPEACSANGCVAVGRGVLLTPVPSTGPGVRLNDISWVPLGMPPPMVENPPTKLTPVPMLSAKSRNSRFQLLIVSCAIP